MARKISPTRRSRPKKDHPRRGVKLPELFVRLKGANGWGGDKYMPLGCETRAGISICNIGTAERYALTISESLRNLPLRTS